MGGHTLVNGNIVYRKAVIKAMRKGVSFFLTKLTWVQTSWMCLQSVLEGKVTNQENW